MTFSLLKAVKNQRGPSQSQRSTPTESDRIIRSPRPSWFTARRQGLFSQRPKPPGRAGNRLGRLDLRTPSPPPNKKRKAGEGGFALKKMGCAFPYFSFVLGGSQIEHWGPQKAQPPGNMLVWGGQECDFGAFGL